MDNGFTYAETDPLETEEEYPYKGYSFKGCQYKKGDGVVGVKSFFDVTPNSPDQLKAALDKQPVSVAIQANTVVFQTYKKGVITSEKCGVKLDHGVLAVGYGTEDGNEYFLVKNSWGPTWGEEGYVKIGVADGAGICGINSQPSAPETNVPTTVGLPPAKSVPDFVAGLLDAFVEENKLTEVEACFNGAKPLEADIAAAIKCIENKDKAGAIAQIQAVVAAFPAELSTCKNLSTDVMAVE